MSDLIIAQNDKGYDFEFTVLEADGSAFDLTDYTVTLKIWRAGYPGTLIVNESIDVDVAASGECSYTIGASDFTDMDDLKFKLVLTKTGVILSSKTYDLEIEEAP